METCYYLILESYTRCNSSHIFQSIYFRNPELKSSSIEIGLCERHFNDVFGWAVQKMKDLQLNIEQLTTRYKKDKAIATESAQREQTRVDPELWGARWIKIEKKINELKDTRGKLCMNELCNKELANIRSQLFSAICFSKTGRSGFKFYFCSFECWKKALIRSGYNVFQKMVNTKLDNY